MMKISLLLFLTSLSAWAQLPDQFNFNYLQLADSNNVSTSGFNLEANHQFFLGNANMITAGVMYSQTQLQDEQLTGVDKNRQLQTFVPNLTLLRSIDNQHNLLIVLRPGFYGDGKGNMNDDFRLEGGFVFNKAMSDKLTLGLGAARGTNLGRDLVVPLLQFLYVPNAHIYATGLLPVRASLWYIKSSKLEIGAQFRLEGSVYYLDDTEIPEATQLGFASAQIGAAVKYNVFGANFVIGEFGVTGLRRYEWQNTKETTMNISREPLVERDLDNVVYLRVGWQKTF
jgi:hypothetical protein